MVSSSLCRLTLIVVLLQFKICISFAAEQPPQSTSFSEYDQKLEVWSKRWDNDNTNWHRNMVNPILKSLGHLVGVPYFEDTESSCLSGDESQQQLRVFVPLCGKSVDLAYFATHPNVSHALGVDGVSKPLEAFAKEHEHLKIQRTSDDLSNSHRWLGNNIELRQTDFFDISTREIEEKFDVIYDRAAIVAIDPLLRQSYLDTIGHFIKPKTGKLLLTVVERTADLLAGPPFSFSDREVRDLYESQSWVASVTGPLEGEPDPGDDPAKWISKTYLIQAK
eukprot:CAMPEP_0198145184 /NCGR_PEP_ID=MMETSP1443-20131203/21718_1 /TAXON_ID=186043 /ORGANISM="Entomoneis sp., Strain CCMP2396" /LENGTH=277 /DNA_ID=CAMNT_0043808751 /DNA_START=118 /DNA_END=948 /DNA_ORIENTATION=+